MNFGNKGGASNQDNLINLPFSDVGIAQSFFKRANALIKDRITKLFKSCPRKIQAVVMVFRQLLHFYLSNQVTWEKHFGSLTPVT